MVVVTGVGVVTTGVVVVITGVGVIGTGVVVVVTGVGVFGTGVVVVETGVVVSLEATVEFSIIQRVVSSKEEEV